MSSLFYRAAKVVSIRVLHAVWRPRVEGMEHVPESGPAIIAANHLSALDSFLLPALMPAAVTFVAKNEYFTGNPITRMIMSGNLAIDRDSAGAAQAMLDAAAGILNEGGLFAHLPRGHPLPRRPPLQAARSAWPGWP